MQFFKRSKDNNRPSSYNEPIIDMLGRDYLSLSSNDANIKFWIPERLEKKIDQLCTYFDTSASDFIRQVLFVHLYGRYDLVGLIERQKNSVKQPMEKYSKRIFETNCDIMTRQKDKNVADVKVWLPSTMKADLQKMADRSNMKLSKYVRLVLVNHIMGCLPVDSSVSSLEPPRELQED